MNTVLKFGEIVKRARLDADRTHYILKRLAGMPKAGSQGVHRIFTLRQALRLAICTHLISAGATLSRANSLVAYCEKRAREVDSQHEISQKGFQYLAPGGLHWFLDILDGRFAKCWRSPLSDMSGQPIRIEFATREFYFDIENDNIVNQIEDPIMVQRIDLTSLETCLAKGND